MTRWGQRRLRRSWRDGLRARALGALLLLAALALAAPAGASPAGGEERLDYNWRVQGFFGAIASLFFPSQGIGSLSRSGLANGNVQSELLIRAGNGEDPDYFRYGAEISAADGSTLRAWSSQLWRGKKKDKSSPLSGAGVVDIASAIELLRSSELAAPRRMEIWSDGKLYPVSVTPHCREEIEVAGRKVATRHIAVRPVEEAERPVWKGELDLWLAADAASTPVRILVARPPARVQLELARYP